MPRYKLIIEYDGAPFCGWQSQQNGIAVQDILAGAVARFCNADVPLFGAGRTDKGVHARGQVAHMDLPKAYPCHKIRDGVNFYLKPHPIAVLDVQQVADDFDARFSACKRHYRYRIICRRAPLILARAHAWWVPHPLDSAAMHEAAQILIGKHDFTTFRAAQCQAASPIRTLDRLDVQMKDESIEIYASARSFLHHQIRSIAGALKFVGEGKWQNEDLRAALQARDRTACAPVAPAHGLYFMHVDYD